MPLIPSEPRKLGNSGPTLSTFDPKLCYCCNKVKAVTAKANTYEIYICSSCVGKMFQLFSTHSKRVKKAKETQSK